MTLSYIFMSLDAMTLFFLKKKKINIAKGQQKWIFHFVEGMQDANIHQR